MWRNIVIFKGAPVVGACVMIAGCGHHSSHTFVPSAPSIVLAKDSPSNATPPLRPVVSLGMSDAVISESSRPWCLASARNEMGVLSREMLTTVAEAKIKGAAAQNAVTPWAIDFVHAQQQVQSSIDSAQHWRGDDWGELRDAIDSGIGDVRKIAAKARAVVDRAPALPLSDPVPWFVSNR